MTALGRSLSFAVYAEKNDSESSPYLPEICSQDDGSEMIECVQRICRKRIRVPNRSDMVADDRWCDSKCLKLMASTVSGCAKKCLNLEALPLDILVRILCGVEYHDLKQMFLVSKAFKEAALIAKESHFSFSTPKPGRHPTRSDSSDSSCAVGITSAGLDEIEAPNAPLRRWYPKNRTGKKFARISVNLFPSALKDW